MHAFTPWRTDPERCQTCDRPEGTHGESCRERTCATRTDDVSGYCRTHRVAALAWPALGEQHGAAAGQAQLPAIVAALLIAAGLVLSLHVGVVATTHQLLAWGW